MRVSESSQTLMHPSHTARGPRLSKVLSPTTARLPPPQCCACPGSPPPPTWPHLPRILLQHPPKPWSPSPLPPSSLLTRFLEPGLASVTELYSFCKELSQPASPPGTVSGCFQVNQPLLVKAVRGWRCGQHLSPTSWFGSQVSDAEHSLPFVRGDHRGWVIIFLTALQHMTLKELATIRHNSSVDTWVSLFLCPCPLPYQLLPRLQTKAFTSEGHTAPN